MCILAYYNSLHETLDGYYIDQLFIIIITRDAKNCDSWVPGRLNFIHRCVIFSVFLLQLSPYTRKQQAAVSFTDQSSKVAKNLEMVPDLR
jgi:hypothetical protein